MSEHIIKKDKYIMPDQDDIQCIYPEYSVKNTMLYTISGRQDFTDEDGFYQIKFQPIEKAKANPFVHAIKHQNRYLVKLGENGKLFNPYGLYSEGMESKQRVGRPTWKFVNTTKDNFNQYINFLKTKNEVFLRNAERDMI